MPVAAAAAAAARSAHSALAVAPRSRATPAGSSIERATGSRRTRSQSPKRRTRTASGGPVGRQRGEVTVVAQLGEPSSRSVGSTRPSVTRAARIASSTAVNSVGDTTTGRPAAAFSASSSAVGAEPAAGAIDLGDLGLDGGLRRCRAAPDRPCAPAPWCRARRRREAGPTRITIRRRRPTGVPFDRLGGCGAAFSALLLELEPELVPEASTWTLGGRVVDPEVPAPGAGRGRRPGAVRSGGVGHGGLGRRRLGAGQQEREEPGRAGGGHHAASG